MEVSGWQLPAHVERHRATDGKSGAASKALTDHHPARLETLRGRWRGVGWRWMMGDGGREAGKQERYTNPRVCHGKLFHHLHRNEEGKHRRHLDQAHLAPRSSPADLGCDDQEDRLKWQFLNQKNESNADCLLCSLNISRNILYQSALKVQRFC